LSTAKVLEFAKEAWGEAPEVTVIPKAKGAMTSLNLSDNDLGAEGAFHIAEGIMVSKCAVAVVVVPFLCPSDHSLNRCCLLLFAG
jgi:hypothetical protein